MDERLQKLLDAAGRTAADAGERASRLVDDRWERLRLVQLREERDLRLREIGGLIYATHTGHPTDSDVLLERLRSVDALERRSARLSGGKERKRAPGCCPGCGKSTGPGDRFCRECGKKL